MPPNFLKTFIYKYRFLNLYKKKFDLQTTKVFTKWSTIPKILGPTLLPDAGEIEYLTCARKKLLW